jgi:hypothetical protein
LTFWNNDLGTYSGHHSSFASWWTRHKILATSNGSSTGTVEARPHNLYHSGGFFGVYLEPLSRRQQGPAGKPGPAGDMAGLWI